MARTSKSSGTVFKFNQSPVSISMRDPTLNLENEKKFGHRAVIVIMARLRHCCPIGR